MIVRSEDETDRRLVNRRIALLARSLRDIETTQQTQARYAVADSYDRAARDQVGTDLGQRHIHNRMNPPHGHQFFHRAPADTRGVKHPGFEPGIIDHLPRATDAGGGGTVHGE